MQTIQNEMDRQFERCSTKCIVDPRAKFNRGTLGGSSNRPTITFDPAYTDFKVKVGGNALQQAQQDKSGEAYISGPMIGTWFVGDTTKKYQIYSDIVAEGRQLVKSENRAAIRERASIHIDNKGNVDFTYGELKRSKEDTKFFVSGLHSLFNYMENPPENYKGGYSSGGKQTTRYNSPIARAYYAQTRDGHLVFGMTKDSVSPSKLKEQLTKEGYVAAYLPDHGSVSFLLDAEKGTVHTPARTTIPYITIGVGPSYVEDPTSKPKPKPKPIISTPDLPSTTPITTPITTPTVAIEDSLQGISEAPAAQNTQTIQTQESFLVSSGTVEVEKKNILKEIKLYSLDIASTAKGYIAESIEDNKSNLEVTLRNANYARNSLMSSAGNYVNNILTSLKVSGSSTKTNINRKANDLLKDVDSLRQSTSQKIQDSRESTSIFNSETLGNLSNISNEASSKLSQYKSDTDNINNKLFRPSETDRDKEIKKENRQIIEEDSDNTNATIGDLKVIVSDVKETSLQKTNNLISSSKDSIDEGVGKLNNLKNSSDLVYKEVSDSLKVTLSNTSSTISTKEQAQIFKEVEPTPIKVSKPIVKEIQKEVQVDNYQLDHVDKVINKARKPVPLKQRPQPKKEIDPSIFKEQVENQISFLKSYKRSNKSEGSYVDINDFTKVDSKDIRVIDADTFNIKSRGSSRLEGVDAPETSVFAKAKQRGASLNFYDYKKIITLDDLTSQHYGVDATKITEEFITSSPSIYLRQNGIDAYGRPIIGLFNKEGKSLANHLLEEGGGIALLPIDKYFKGTPEAHQQSELMIEAYKQGKGMWANDYVRSPTDFRNGLWGNYKKHIETYLMLDKPKSKGMLNNEYNFILADERSSFTLSASAGASYHYGKSLHNTLMNQAGYANLASELPVMGVAESVMRANALLKGDDREPTAFELFAARSFDTGLNTSGFGMWLNEKIFLPSGWGRVYKDELGAVPSIAGLAGRILDEGYMYYASVSPDYLQLGSDTTRGLGYSAIDNQRKEGIFETTFAKGAELIVASAQSLGLYMAVSQPIEMLKAAMNQSFLESAMQDVTVRGGGFENAVAVHGKLKPQEKIDLVTDFILSRYHNINTPTTSKSIAESKRFLPYKVTDIFEPKNFYFGELFVGQEMNPGGISAAVLEHSWAAKQKGIRFFEYSDTPENQRYLVKSMYTNILQIQRRRGVNVLNSVFRPFLEDFVNPFDASGPSNIVRQRGGKSVSMTAYEAFNETVTHLIDAVGRPPTIEPVLTTPYSFKQIKLQPKDQTSGVELLITTENNIRRAKVHLGSNKNLNPQEYLKFTQGETTPVKTYEALMEAYTKEKDLYTTELIKVQRKINTKRTYLSRKAGAAPHDRIQRVQDEIVDLTHQENVLKATLAHYKSQLGEAGQSITTHLKGVGIDYKMSIAKHTQDLLDMIPVAPWNWGGAFGKSITNKSDVLMIGQLFSFHRSAQMVAEAITGENILTRILHNSEHFLVETEDLLTDASTTVKELRKQQKEFIGPRTLEETEALDNKIKDLQNDIDIYNDWLHRGARNIRSRVETFDRTIYNVADFFKSELKDTAGQGLQLHELNKAFRKFEISADKLGRFELAESLSDDQVVNNAGKKIARMTGSDDRLYVSVEGKGVTQVMDDLIDAVGAYNKVMMKAKGLDAELLSRVAAGNKAMNVAGDVARVQKGLGKNILLEAGMQNKRWLGAAAVFASVALNNVMQSTGGASLVSQMGMMIAGEGYDIAVEAQGNRVLPIAEITNQMFGWDPVITNVIIETGTIGAALSVGRQIAKRQNALGYMIYHNSEAMMREAINHGGQVLYAYKSIVDPKTGKTATEKILSQVTFDDIFDDKNPISVVFMGKKGQAIDNVNDLAKFTVLKDRTFKSDAFIRQVTEEMPTKTLVYGTLALLALGGARNTLATAMNALNKHQGWEEGITNVGGLGAAGFALGAALQVVHSRKVSAQAAVVSKKLGITAGQKISEKMATNFANEMGASILGRAYAKGMGKANPFLLAGVGMSIGILTGFYRTASKGVFEDVPGGSLDPLVFGVVAGSLTGVLTRSPATALISAVATGFVANTLNWAGIKLFRTQAKGQVHDINSLQEVAQLGFFATSVLENDRRASMEALVGAAFGAQYAKGKELLSKEFNDVGQDVRTVARQSPLPFLQFFTAERVKGRGNHGSGAGNPLGAPGTVTTYSIGVQTGPLLGTSISVELPIVYTPKQGFMGLTYNPEHNLMDLYEFTGKVGAWAALTLGSAEVVTSMMGRLFQSLPSQMFEETAEFMFEASKALGRSNQLIFGATAKINEIATSTLIRTATGLWGADVQLGVQLLRGKLGYNDDVLKAALSIGIDNAAEVSKLRMHNPTFAEAVEKAHKSINNYARTNQSFTDQLGKHRFGATIAQGKSFFMGFVLGAATVSAAALVKQAWDMKGEDYDYIAEKAAEWEAHKYRYATYTIAAGFAGGTIANWISRQHVFTDATGTLATGYETLFGTIKVHNLDNWRERKISQGLQLIHNKGIQVSSRLAKLKNSKWAGGLTLAAAGLALFASQYMRIDSDFGLIKYMDSHILYRDKGKSSDPNQLGYEISYKKNRGHQSMVALGLTAIYGSAFMFVARPLQTRKELLINFAAKHSSDKSKTGIKNFIVKVADTLTPNFFKNFRDFGADQEVLHVIQRLNQKSVELAIGLEGKPLQQFLQGASQETLDLRELYEYFGDENIKQFQKIHKVVQHNKHAHKIVTYNAAGEKEVTRGLIDVAPDQMRMYNEILEKLQAVASGNAKHSAAKNAAKDATERVMMGTLNTLMDNRSLRRFGMRTAGVFAMLWVVRMGANTFFNSGGMMGGPSGQNSYLDRIYEHAARQGMWGSEKHGNKVSFLQGLPMVGADILRVFLGRDRVDLNLIDHFNRTRKTSGEKLMDAPMVGTYQQYKQGMSDLKSLQDMLVIDKSNAYFATLDFGGKTIRRGERGVYTSTYFQLQGTGHDISTAAYSMATKWIFRDYIAGRGHTSRLIDNAVGRFEAGEFSQEDTATLLRNVTSQSFALKEARKYSRLSVETGLYIGGDSLMNSIIRAREAELEHIAWQPVDSLFSNMFFEASDKAKRQLSIGAFEAFMRGVATGDEDIMKTFGELMQEGAFKNFFRNSVIKNVTFFGGGTRKKSKNQLMLQDFASLWADTSSLTIQMEMYKQARPMFDEWMQETLMDDTIIPLTTTGILTFMPKPVFWVLGVGGVAMTTLWASHSIAKWTKTKQFKEGVEETTRFWSGEAYKRSYAAGEDILTGFNRAAEETARKRALSVEDYALERRAAEASEMVMAPLESDLPINSRFKRAKGNKYTIRVTQGMSTTDFAMSDFINSIETIAGKTKKSEVIDYFLNLAERYGTSMSRMMEVLDPATGAARTMSQAMLGEVTTSRIIDNARKRMSKPELYINGMLVGKPQDVVLGTQEIAASVRTELSTYLLGDGTNNKKGLIDAWLDVIYKESDLLAEVDVNIGGEVKSYRAYQLIGDRIDADGAVRPLVGESYDRSKDALTAGAEDLANMRKQTRAWIQAEIEKVIEEQIDYSGRQLARDMVIDTTGSLNLEKQIKYINNKILSAISSHPQMKALLETNGGILKADNLINSSIKRRALNEFAKKQNLSKVETKALMRALLGEGDALHYSLRAGVGDVGGVLFKGLEGIGIIMDLAYGLDLYGAYARTTEAFTSPFATNLDRAMAKRELGSAALSTAWGVATTIFMANAMKGMGKGFEFAKKNWGWIAGGAATLALLGKPVYKNIIKPGLHRAGKFFEENEAMKNAGRWMRDKSGVVDEVIGTIAWAPAEATAKVFETVGGALGFDPRSAKENGYKFGGFGMGTMALAGVALATVAYTFSLPVSLPLVGIVLGSAFLVGGVSGLVGADKLTEWSTMAIRSMKSMPVIGEWVAGFMTDPYRASRDKASKDFAAMLQDSPFQLGYIGEIVNKEWIKVLSAADDPSGGDMVGALFGEVLDTGTELNTAWRKNATSGLIGGPSPITDQLIDRELRIRAQRYSDDVIGNYQWTEMRKYADHSKVVEQHDRQIRDYKALQRDLYRANLMSAALKGSASVNSAGGKGAKGQTVLNQAHAENALNKAMKRAEAGAKNEGMTLVSASVEVPATSVKDSNEDLFVETIALATGNMTDPRHKKEYTMRLGEGDNNTVFIDVERRTPTDNDLDIAHLSGLGTKRIGASNESQQSVHEHVSKETLMPAIAS